MAQMWPPPKPKLAQEEFDEAVKTNVEDFDMQVGRLARQGVGGQAVSMIFHMKELELDDLVCTATERRSCGKRGKGVRVARV